MDCQDVSRELGRLWKELSDSERRPWNELAVYDRARYEAEMKNYNNPFLREAALYEDEVDILYIIFVFYNKYVAHEWCWCLFGFCRS